MMKWAAIVRGERNHIKFVRFFIRAQCATMIGQTPFESPSPSLAWDRPPIGVGLPFNRFMVQNIMVQNIMVQNIEAQPICGQNLSGV
jgi:hypothetical protein